MWLVLGYGCSVYLLIKPIHTACERALEQAFSYDSKLHVPAVLSRIIRNRGHVLTHMPATHVSLASPPRYLIFLDASIAGGASVIHQVNLSYRDQWAIASYGGKILFCQEN